MHNAHALLAPLPAIGLAANVHQLRTVTGCAVRCALCAVRCAAVVDVSVVVAGTAEDSDVPAAVARLGVSEQLNVLASGGRAAVVAVGAGAERVTAAVGGLLACGLHHDGLENALHEGDVRGIAEWLQRATSTQTGARIIAQVTALLCVRACVREHGGRRGVKSRRSSSALLTSPALFPPPPCYLISENNLFSADGTCLMADHSDLYSYIGPDSKTLTFGHLSPRL